MRLQKGILYALMAVAMAACNSQSEIDSNFLSNLNPTSSPVPTPAPFSSNFSFATANSSQYNFDSTKIDFSNGYAELTSSSQTDNSNVAAGFAGGSSTGTTFSTATDGNSNSNYVMLSQSETPTNNSELDSSWTPEWANLLGYWKLDNDWTDSKGSANGTPHGGPTFSSSSKLGSSAGNFTGAQYIDLGTSINPSSGITIAAWIKTTQSGADKGIISNWGNTGGGNADQGFVLADRNGNAICALNGLNSADLVLVGSKSISDGNWHHIVCRGQANNSENNFQLFVDGAVDAQSTVGTNLLAASLDPLYIGTHAATNYFNGLIDDVAIWSIGLSATEIQLIYSRQSVKYAGTFTSRVMDGLSSSANWTNFSWAPTLPFFKELPDSTNPASPVSESQANYSSLIDSTTTPGTTKNLMDSIVGLWHLDDAEGGSTVADSSGNGNSGVPQAGVTLGGTGKLNSAPYFDGAANAYIDLGSVSNLPSTNGAITISSWIKIPSLMSGMILARSALNGIALYAVNDGTNEYLEFAKIGVANTGSNSSFTPISIGQWHHIAVVNRIGIDVTYYIDGQFKKTLPFPYTFGTAGNLYIGYEAPDNLPFMGYIDELAVWSRIVSTTEISELYRRGANRIKYQVRTCTASDCSDDATNANWKGPDNTNQTYFSELNNNAVQSDGGDLNGSDSVQAGLPTMTFANFSGLTVPTNRYFQYRAIMESDDTSTNCTYDGGATHTWCSPELKVVSAGPGHFDTTAPTITNKTGLSYDTLTTLVETIDSNGCGSGTVYNISPDNTNWYYWTGAAWGLSDGTVSKANPATTITSNLSTFAAQVGTGTVYFKVFLQSSGTSTCAIDSLSISGTH